MFVEIQRNLKKPYPIILTAAGSTETQSAISRPNGFEFHHILWVTQGEGLFHFAGEPRHIGAGYGVFMNRTAPMHTQRAGKRLPPPG